MERYVQCSGFHVIIDSEAVIEGKDRLAMTRLRNILRRLYTIVIMPDFVMGVGETGYAPRAEKQTTHI